MAILVACLSSGKGTWLEVSKLANDTAWDKVFIITNNFGRDNFKKNGKTELIIVDDNKDVTELTEDIRKSLKDKINDMEVAVNFLSGNGKEHMALVNALLKLGLGIRFVVYDNGIKEI